MNLLTGKTGTPHVTSQQMRQVYEGCFGEESYILKTDEMLEPVLVSNNLLKIRSGVLVHHGNISVVGIGTADEVVLKNGAQGVKRIDLVVSRYKKNAETEIEECDWVLIQGIPDATNPKVPAYTVGNMQTGSLVDDCAAIRIDYDGIQVTSVTKLLPVLEGNIATLNSNLADRIVIDEKSLVGSGVSYMHLPNKLGYILTNAYCHADNFYSVEVRTIRQNSVSGSYTILFTANIPSGTSYAMRFVWVKQ